MGTGGTQRRNKHMGDGLIFHEITTDRRKRSRVGIILYKDRPKVGEAFHEELAQVGSYRAERLGLLAIHLLLAAITQHFGISTGTTKIYCDNKGDCMHPQREARE